MHTGFLYKKLSEREKKMKFSGYGVLDNVDSCDDIKHLSNEELKELCRQTRRFLIDNISKTGGHLAANLGIVEISVAICKLFDMPLDKVIYDVGHQCYVHKMFTGRKDEMDTIRSKGGISGFLRPSESVYDAVVSGHASTSISSGIGYLRGEKLMGTDGRVVCVVGDGALTGGMAYEALNDAGQSGEPLIVILNDNEMAISRNVGAISKKMGSLRLKPRYFKIKRTLKSIAYKLPFGENIVDFLRDIKSFLKKVLLKESIFEIMGFAYLGPCDGNNIDTVVNVLSEAKRKNVPIVVHFKTQKGRGYKPSEEKPEKYHGISPFDKSTGKVLKYKNHNFSIAFGNKLAGLAADDKRICAITAAMPEGTGLVRFSEEFPDRFFDVGIAEEHGVTMAAALAKTGMIPFFAVYATFLQRGFDQLIHDVAIDGMHVIFGIDRAGITGEDGETHQGVFDVPEILAVPNITLLSPSTYDELDEAIDIAVRDFNSPVAIRYPRGVQKAYKENHFSLSPYILREGKDITIVTYGIMVNEALKCADILAQKGIETEIVKLNCLTDGYMPAVLESVEKTGRIAVLEECVESGSLGEKIASEFFKRNKSVKFTRLFNVGKKFVHHGKVDEILRDLGLDGESVAREIEIGVKNV